MKKRSRVGRQRSHTSRLKALSFVAASRERKRKAFTFEQLEDRFCFSTSPLEVQTVSISSDTAEGAAALWMRELQWAALQSASQSGAQGAGYTTLSLPSDPLFADQWHLLNTGQEVGNPDFQAIFGVAGEDINVVPAWNLGYDGKGVVVAVNDTGVQGLHPDLKDNLHPTLRYNAITGTNNASPNLNDPGAPHGTAVAGLIGATADNGIGGSGVAPGATLVPVLLIGFGTTSDAIARAFNFATQNDIDVTNNSWGPGAARVAVAMSPGEIQALRDSILFGRDGLGIVHVFASGNSGGPSFAPGFQGIGNWDSSNYDGYVNSRYVITVTGVDHDGLYANDDGTFTAYPEAGSNVLVAAPTGSNAALSIADDTGLGSGIWTTDLVDDFGYNAVPLPSGFDPDRDFLEDPDYTSRFNGTSAASPIAAGVVALMLEANPNLTYRDVQEILVRSARQNAQFEVPSSGGSGSILQDRPLVTTWQTNQVGPFRDPDPWVFNSGQSPFLSVFDPIADPNIERFFVGGFGDSFPTRSFTSHYEPQPGQYTNAAGYTVSQGYGIYSEMTGYGHGVIDAGLAVTMAEQWHTLNQELSPERTYSTFVVQPDADRFYNFPAAEKMDDDFGAMIVPGGIGGVDGFIDYWNEYFADDDPADPADGPFSDDDPPANSRGNSFWQFKVPDNQSINVEWVEVKVSLTGPDEDLDFIRINMTSPEGTVSELQHYYTDPALASGVWSYQPVSTPPGEHDPAGDIGTGGGVFVWTFSTNRSWGESTKTTVVTDPTTGEPLMERDFSGQPIAPFERGWELHMENWSDSEFAINAVEIVWHGKPIEAAAERVQGFIGIDTNADENFNYSRYDTFLYDSDFDQGVLRTTEFVNEPDLTQEPFAANVLVEAYRIVDGAPEDDPVGRFLTGADGNYYFDLVPGDYIIRATDPQERVILEDTTTDPMFRKHFRREWVINEDWFYASDRDLPVIGDEVEFDDNNGFFGFFNAKNEYSLGDIFYDATTDAPVKFEYMVDELGTMVTKNVPSGVKNLNFLIKEDAQPEQIIISGTVFADVNGNGVFDDDDTPAGGVFVYADTNRNGVRDSGEQTVTTSEDPLTRGQYSMTIFADHLDTYAVGVVPPSSLWIPTNPADAVQDLFAGPGAVLNDVDFFLDPPNEAFPPAGSDEPGNILGVVYNDSDEDRIRDLGEVGVPGFRVYIDADEDGNYDVGEQFSITSSNGSFLLADVAPGILRIEIEIENEGTEDASWELTSPLGGFRLVQLGPGGTVSGVQFGIGNRADRDWGDLPSSYGTRAGDSPAGGPSHVIIPGFQLGGAIDGEVNGQPTANANGDDLIGQDDDGVKIRTNNGSLQLGVNVLDVTLLGVGGYLNGWIDLNGDGQFGLGEHVIADLDLNPGVRQVTVNLPAGTVDGPLAARFRWGERGLGVTGPAGIGEVEDYFLPNSIAQSAVLAGDYDLNGTVNDDDHAIWRATFGTSDPRADGNGNGIVDLGDYVVWKNNFGATTGTGTANGDVASQDQLAIAGVTYGDSVGFAVQGTVGGHTGASLSGASTVSQAAQSHDAVALSPFLFDIVEGSSVGGGTSLISTLVERVVAASDANSADLLLLDEAWATLDRDAEADCDDDATWTVEQDGDDEAGELALAAVLEGDWWARL